MPCPSTAGACATPRGGSPRPVATSMRDVLRPGHYQAIANRAFLSKKQGRLNDALEEFGQAIADNRRR